MSCLKTRLTMRHLKKRVFLSMLLFMILPYVVILGNDRVYVKVTNQTTYYLHIIINGEAFLYVTPGRTVTLEAEGKDATMEAFYAPGQGISGSVEQTAQIPTYEVDCGGGSCNEGTGSESTNPIVWVITPDLLQSGVAGQ